MFQWSAIQGLPPPTELRERFSAELAAGRQASRGRAPAGNAGAAVDMLRAATWNTQGANISEDNVNDIVDGLAADMTRVVMLQEVRRRPARGLCHGEWAMLTRLHD